MNTALINAYKHNVMKKTIFLIACAFLFFYTNASDSGAKNNENTLKQTTIHIVCSPEVNDLVKGWITEYKALHPKYNVSLISEEPGKFSDLIANGSVGIASADEIDLTKEPSLRRIVVGREIIVPVINSSNPNLGEINKQGFSLQMLAKIFTEKSESNWGQWFSASDPHPVNVYLSDDGAIKKRLAAFLNVNDNQITANLINGKEIASVLQHDPYGIAFCKLNDVLNSDNTDLVSQIQFLPIDKNGNGNLDYFENIYKNPFDLQRGVWIGKYYNALSGNLYVVFNDKAENVETSGFLQWVITEGQKNLDQQGFNELLISERQSKLEKLKEPVFTTPEPGGNLASLKLAGIIVIGLLMVGITIVLIFNNRRKKKSVTKDEYESDEKVVSAASLDLPGGLYFDKTHTWAYMEKQGTVKVGIDDFLQHITGTFTGVKMKAPGEEVKKNEQILTLIKDGKQLNIYSPVSGTIQFINEDLATEPSLINTSPYNKGWLYEIKPSNWTREIQFMRMAEKYKDWLKYELNRLKDFLAYTVHVKSVATSPIMLQDGGEIIDHVLQDLSPQVWEDFQKNFIDNSELK